jgi:hypothetical protein
MIVCMTLNTTNGALMPRGLKVSRVLIANMILFVNTHNFFNHKLFALGHLM